MELGKKICETLKEVRLQVARANDIDYTPTQCNHEGDCPGTCPRCEQEVRMIEDQLALRRAMGKAIKLVGVGAGIVALASCQLILHGGQEKFISKLLKHKAPIIYQGNSMFPLKWVLEIKNGNGLVCCCHHFFVPETYFLKYYKVYIYCQ